MTTTQTPRPARWQAYADTNGVPPTEPPSTEPLHPGWCDLTTECAGSRLGPRHDGRTFQMYTDDGCYRVRLRLSN